MLLQSWELKENGLKREYDEVAGKVKFFAINPPPVIEAIVSLQTESDRTGKSVASSLETDSAKRPYVNASPPDPQPTETDVQNVDAIAPKTASLPTAKTSPDDLAAAKIAYASKLKITYKRNPDGSLMLKSIRGITEKDFKKLSDGELKALGLYRESKGVTTKYWEIQADRLEGKAIAPKPESLYRFNKDGSVILRSIVETGIALKTLQKLSDEELKNRGLFREAIGIDAKYYLIPKP